MARRAIPTDVDRRIRERARHRCGYCLSPQSLVMARLEIDHIVPLAKGGSDDETNLWLACPIYNRHKSDKTEARDPETGQTVPLFHPGKQVWAEHFAWSADGVRVIGKTAIGRATIQALHLSDDPNALVTRSYWVIAGWHPPRD